MRRPTPDVLVWTALVCLSPWVAAACQQNRAPDRSAPAERVIPAAESGTRSPARPMSGSADAVDLDAVAPDAATGRPASFHGRPRLANRVAYIPPQCFTKTRSTDGAVTSNPCYACHTKSNAPNYANDGSLQLAFAFPHAAKNNPWTNLFDPPISHTARSSDEDVLAYVRESNYFTASGEIALSKDLASPPPTWDTNSNGKWDGFVPDMWFRFDERGFDHRPDASFSGWRAFAYYPFLGTFFPTNGSADDVAIRLPSAFQEGRDGVFDRRIYEINLAIVEALVRRVDVPIDPVDETALGVDLDDSGRLGMASHVGFSEAADGSGRTRMHYVGRAHDEELHSFMPIAPGLYPIGTEFFHTVRYLDVGSDGMVAMAPRMKEVRYARKTHWASYEILRGLTRREAQEQDETWDGTHEVHWAFEQGVATRTWLLQGFIEGPEGSLRPQSFEETAYCEGCHAGIGATTDGTFAFARKLPASETAHGWFHWSQRGLKGIAEPRRADGKYVYTNYLEEAGAGDELRENTEVIERFYDERHSLRPDEITQLHGDIARLLLPTPARALDLDRAYRAIVAAQSFDRGRETLLRPARNVYRDVPLGEATGVRSPVMADQRIAAGHATANVRP